jgi:hypothetical protein
LELVGLEEFILPIQVAQLLTAGELAILWQIVGYSLN